MLNLLNLKTKPVEIFENCTEGRKIIYNKYKEVTAIYMWYNKFNNKCYIGSAYKLYNRISEYFSIPKILNSNRIIDKSINKYKLDSFFLIILEIIEKESNLNILEFKKKYLKVEQFYMDLYKPEYNIAPIAGSVLGFKHSEETKNKFFRGENNPFYGKKHSPEFLEFLSISRKGINNPLYKKPKSPEFLAQQQKNRKGSLNHNSKKVFVYLVKQENLQFFKEFETIISVADFLGCSKTTVSKYCRQKKYFKFLDTIYYLTFLKI